MIKTAIDLRPAIKYILKNTTNSEFQKNSFTKSEWDSLTELMNIFGIFLKPSVKLQG